MAAKEPSGPDEPKGRKEPSGSEQPKPTKKRKKRLRWTPTPYTKAGLMRIQKLGIFGQDTSQIVNHLIGEELRRLLASKLLDQKELDQAVDSLPPDEREPPPKLDEED